MAVTEIRFLHLPTTLAIWNDSGARGTDLLVLLTVGTYMPASGGSCWPSNGALAERAGVKPKTVRAALGRLEESGMVLVERRVGRSSILTLKLTTTPQMGSTQMGSSTQMGTPQMVVNPSPNAPLTTPHLGSRSKEVKKNISDEVDELGFSEFWDVFPKKREKQKAAEKFRQAIKGGAIAEEIIEGASAYANAVQGTESRFIKYPAGWLEDERWSEYLASEADDSDNITHQRIAREKAEWCASVGVSVAEYEANAANPSWLVEHGVAT
jgi:DNA-binding transcriptional ArsR family regulator